MLRVISFNIRYCDDLNENSIAERAPRLEKILSEYDADIIGFQEYTPKWEKYIDLFFKTNYDMVKIYRSETDFEATPILWKKDKFVFEKSYHFWLSDTPDTESKGWDEICDCCRMCVCVKLVEKSTGKKINFINTHFGFGDNCQLKSISLINHFCQHITDEPICIVGDFNMQPTSNGYKEMIKYFDDTNSLTAKDYRNTYHGYFLNSIDGLHIDYCFVNKMLYPKSRKLIDKTIDGKFPSDHFGVYIEFENL